MFQGDFCAWQFSCLPAIKFQSLDKGAGVQIFKGTGLSLSDAFQQYLATKDLISWGLVYLSKQRALSESPLAIKEL